MKIKTGEDGSYCTAHTVKNGVFQNSSLGCLNVHSSTTPNRVFLKLPFDGVSGHPRTPLQVAVNHSKGCYANTSIYHLANSKLYVIVSDLLIICNIILQYMIVLQNQHNIILCSYIRGKNLALIFF